MDSHRQLVEDWKAKLAASAPAGKDQERRFAWVRQIYTRIYRFLVSCYGDGEWRGADEGLSASVDSAANASHMPFVDHCSTTDGLAPKSPERIRAALDAIHSSNPGIATAGTRCGVDDDTWVVVAAGKQSPYAVAVHRRLVACGIAASLQDRATDTAVVVRHEDFQRALAVVKQLGRENKVRVGMRAPVDPIIAVGVFLFTSSLLAFLAFMPLSDAMQRSMRLAVCALWIAALTSAWLCARGRRTM